MSEAFLKPDCSPTGRVRGAAASRCGGRLPFSAMAEKTHKLLIVDDDVDTRELLVEGLADEFEVRAVPDAAAALRVIDEWMPDVVLTDESLPGMRGVELAQTLKERAPQLRVILFSGHLNIPGSEAADLVLRKPLDLPELHEAVSSQRH